MQKKLVVPILIFAIMAGAFFVRIYSHEEWLYFKMDQARDAFLITKAMEDPGYLPLLGPRAGATDLENGFLRLGPAYYYFQYLSALIFQSVEPQVLAYPDLFFGMAAILLLYFLVRIYFSKKLSLMIMAMYAFSFIVIEYSRFAWNPNSLQFFLLLTFFALLKFLGEEQEKKKKWWIALWALALAIGSQLHFFGFFSLLGISGLLIAFQLKPWLKDSWSGYFKKQTILKFLKYSAVVVIVFAVIYTPVIISDLFENGQNSKNFIEALGSKPGNKSLAEKIGRNIEEHLKYYCVGTIADCYKRSAWENLAPALSTGAVLLVSFFLAIWNLIKATDARKRNFLALIVIWVGVFSILTIPVAHDLRPRFFIIVFAVPFILLGILFEFLEKKFGKRGLWMSVAIFFAVLAMNARGTYAWFREQSMSQEKNLNVDLTLILKAQDGVTLGQFRRAANFIAARHEPGKNIYYAIKPEHDRPLDYVLEKRLGKDVKTYTLKINEDPDAQFFAIVINREDALEKIAAEFGPDFEVLSSEKVGQIAVFEISLPSRIVSQDFKMVEKENAEDRFFWKDVLKNIIKKTNATI
ncbi:MAG: phospholipid carrier-dependent glycosyltransferase [Parcubacteria group bacterium]|jgi:4-amino-4-deoxy-L-arabinose transferase-like glycosyltransferase